MLYSALTTLALVGSALAQGRPANTSICDYYTTALLKQNTPANQYTLLTLVVNTAVIGNYTKPNVGIKVPGILAQGMYNGTAVNLLPYFDGGLASTNDGVSSSGVAMNFLDDGGAAPLMMNLPSNGNTTSNQYMLLTHLYQFFGVLLGCSDVGVGAFPAYQGGASMYEVHKFMDLDPYQMGYFITQVGLSAASFGVAVEDVTAVGMALAKLFDYRCAPPVTVVPAQGPQLQAICIADTCPLSPNATCASYSPAVQPLVANVTLAMGEGVNATMSASATASGPAMPTHTIVTAGAGRVLLGVGGLGAVAVAAVALLL